MPVQPTGSQIAMFTWKITNFTELTENKYYSVPFRIDNDNWRIVLYPKGNNRDHLSMYLVVADSAKLSHGWTRFAKCSLTVVNQRNSNSSIKREICHKFCAGETSWGYPRMVALSVLHNQGFLVNDTLIVAVGVNVTKVSMEERPVDASSEMLDSYFSSLEQFISRVNDVPVCCASSPSNAQCPTLDEVKNAKRSLKECLSNLFKLNMKDRLAESLSTLSRAEVGLSAGQSSSVRTFWARFEDFTSDFLTFEQDNAEFELQKLLKDHMFCEMKRGHEAHILFKKLSEDIAKEEEECERKMEEIRAKKAKLESDWEVLLVESQEAKSKYVEHETKAKDAEEKKRVAEERMSRSTTAWSNLKAEFA